MGARHRFTRRPFPQQNRGRVAIDRGVVVPVPPFVPTDISGLVLWIDPSDAGAVTTVSAALADGSDFSSAAWTPTNVTIAPNVTLAPDSTTTADQMTTASTTTPQIRSTSGVTGASTGATKVPTKCVFYAKRVDADWIALQTQATTNTTWFNLGSGTVGTVSPNHSGASITDVGNGWFRCEVTVNITSATHSFRLGLTSADNVATGPTVGSSVYIWGASATEVRYSALTNKASAVAWTNAAANSQPGFTAAAIGGRSALQGYGAQQIISGEAAVAGALGGTDPPYALFYVATLPLDGVNRGVFGVGNSGVATNGTQVWGQGLSGTSKHRTSRTEDAGGANTAIATATAAAGPHVVEWYRATATLLSCQVDGGAADPSNTTLTNAGVTTTNQSALLCRPDSSPDTFHVGLLGEILLYNRILTPAERSQVRVYLGGRWAITVTP